MRAAPFHTPVEIDPGHLDAAEGSGLAPPLKRKGRRKALTTKELERAPSTEPGALSGARPVLREGIRATERLNAVDAARVLATLGIVWTHVAEANGLPLSAGAWGRFGTSFYVIAAALFIVRSAHGRVEHRLADDVKKRAQRLLIPFATWSAIYATYYGTLGRMSGHSWESLTFWWGPVAGTAIHLWFLPFIFFWGALGAWAAPALGRLPRTVLFVAGPLLCAACYFVAHKHLFYAVDRFWLWKHHLHRLDRWVEEVPLFVTTLVGGVAFYRLPPVVYDWLRRNRVLIAIMTGALFFTVQVIYGQTIDHIKQTAGTDGRLLANVAGISLLCTFLCFSGARLFARIAPLGRYTYLAFLCHMLVLHALASPLQWLLGGGTIQAALMSTLLVFTASVLLSRWVAHSPRLRWLRP